MRFEWGSRTDVGRVRKRNEDALLAVDRLYVVADGMGGHADGNVASAMTVEALHDLAGRTEVLRTDVMDTIRRVDAEIRWRATDKQRGMGTTVTGLAVVGDDENVLVFNVGDSRCYRLRSGTLVQLTHDHSVVQELIDAGEITEDEAERHPDRNVITRSLGSDDLLEIDWGFTEPNEGDRFLICSDGVTREVNSERIAQILSGAADPQKTADDLIEAALASGGRDNASAIVVDVHTATTPNRTPSTDDDPMAADTEPRDAGLVIDTSTALARADPPPRTSA